MCKWNVLCTIHTMPLEPNTWLSCALMLLTVLLLTDYIKSIAS